jgi:hypothetical protein
VHGSKALVVLMLLLVAITGALAYGISAGCDSCGPVMASLGVLPYWWYYQSCGAGAKQPRRSKSASRGSVIVIMSLPKKSSRKYSHGTATARSGIPLRSGGVGNSLIQRPGIFRAKSALIGCRQRRRGLLMNKEITQLEHPIDAMLWIHRALQNQIQRPMRWK